ARADVELPLDLGEVPLHGTYAREQLGRDLLVRPAGGDQLGDAPLGRRELAGRPRASADALELATSSVGPETRAELLEDRERLLQGFARRALLLEPPQRRPLGEERVRTVEAAVLHPRVLGQSALEGRDGGRLVAARRRQQAAAAGDAGERPLAVEPDRPLLDPVEQLHRLVELADRDRRLGVDRKGEVERRLLHAPGAVERARLPGVLERLRGSADGELEHAKSPAGDDRRMPEAQGLRAFGRAGGRLARFALVSEMGVEDGVRTVGTQQHLRTLALDTELAHLVRERQAPWPVPCE